MKNILEEITAVKQQEVAQNKELYPIKLLEKSPWFDSPTVSLSHYIKRSDKSGIIAEFKRRSPSKGDINPYADPEKISIGYMQSGASALSVLTDKQFFGGSSQDLTTARKFNYCPILRKDFIVDEYQIVEARSIGADAILLIAEVLTAQEVKSLSGFAKRLGLEVLMELHSEAQLDKYCDSIDLIGVNNRNLETFEVNTQTSLDLLPKLPTVATRISESGISDPSIVRELKSAGFDGFLIGENFMKTADPAKACGRFIQHVSA